MIETIWKNGTALAPSPGNPGGGGGEGESAKPPSNRGALLQRWAKRLIVGSFLLNGEGCASYTQIKMDLVDQSLRASAQVRAAAIERQLAIEQIGAARRAAVDAAFDADARGRMSLSAEWVIDARRAYAIALDATNRQAETSREAGASMIGNLDALDAALRQLQKLHQLEGRLGAIGGAR